jgi:Flp pilus assembly protein TadD
MIPERPVTHQPNEGGAMRGQEFRQLVRKGITAANQGNTLAALLHFETAARLGSTPTLNSYLGYCMAQERQQFKEAIGLCHQALAMEPENAIHYLNLGRVLLAAGEKRLAIKTFHQGLKRDRHRLILEEMKRLGIRRRPVVPLLSRSHPVNKYLGRAFIRLRLR